MERKHSRALEAGLLALLAAAWLATWLPRLRGPIDLRWDAAVYYTLGTSLASGHGYRLLNEPGQIASVQYPPGLPLIVAAHQRALGTDDPVVVGRALRRSYVAISGLYVLSVYALLRSFGPWPAFAGALLCALGMTFVWVSDRCYSDAPFLLAVTWFALLSRRTHQWGRIGAGIVAGAAFALRTVGAALLVGWVADAAFARRWRECAVRLLLTAVLVGGWQGYVSTVERSAEYQAPAYPYQRAAYLLYNVSYMTNASLKRPFFPHEGRVSTGDALRRFAGNVANVPAAIGETLSTSSENWYVFLEPYRDVPALGLAARWRAIRTGLALVGLLAIAGAVVRFRRGDAVLPVAVATYVLGVCAMTFNEEFGRYLSGIVPLFVLLLFTALLTIRLPALFERSRMAIIALTLGGLFAGEGLALRAAFPAGLTPVTHTWHGHGASYHLFSYADTFRSFDEAIDWVAGRAAGGDVIASSQPHWVYLRTGKRAVMPPFERDPAVQQTLLDSVPVSYVIVDGDGFSATREYSLPALATNGRWERVYRSQDGLTDVYRRKKVDG